MLIRDRGSRYPRHLQTGTVTKFHDSQDILVKVYSLCFGERKRDDVNHPSTGRWQFEPFWAAFAIEEHLRPGCPRTELAFSVVVDDHAIRNGGIRVDRLSRIRVAAREDVVVREAYEGDNSAIGSLTVHLNDGTTETIK